MVILKVLSVTRFLTFILCQIQTALVCKSPVFVYFFGRLLATGRSIILI
nr:MAG TPA: hypothetical protein [Caudoviricetes sp.]